MGNRSNDLSPGCSYRGKKEWGMEEAEKGNRKTDLICVIVKMA
jgi:hypothetical protein